MPVDRCSTGDELQRQAVVAPPLAGGGRSVIEDVSLMASTTDAMVFPAWQDKTKVQPCFHTSFDGSMEAGPSRARFELGRCIEKSQAATSADIEARSMLMEQGR